MSDRFDKLERAAAKDHALTVEHVRESLTTTHIEQGIKLERSLTTSHLKQGLGNAGQCTQSVVPVSTANPTTSSPSSNTKKD
jgi:hypothetical protein